MENSTLAPSAWLDETRSFRGQCGQLSALFSFCGGIGMISSRLDVPVVPVRIDGVHRVLHTTWRFPRPGRVRVAFGAPIRLRGDDYAALAAQVERWWVEDDRGRTTVHVRIPLK